MQEFALYFSREPIPSRWKSSTHGRKFKQVCVIPFRRDFLLTYTNLEPTPLEKLESIDMLRILEHGYQIKMVRTEFEVYSVDTQDDLLKVENIMENDELYLNYAKEVRSLLDD
jgi:3-deoxy-manno-octulosonate cytidylyltransferase (CMP-KDO synthetase)